MSVHPSVRGVWSFVFSVFLLSSLSISRAQEELPPEIDSDGVQTLTRGPVHEAFASPTVADPKPGLVVPKPPPADIREQPPEYQPDGQNVQWFPGYWAWDEDRDDYIWISGAWRDPPPGKRWVPGYWAEVDGGFQWVSGFWIDDQVEEVEYLKAPPASLEQGPTVASPGDDYFYIPGTWTYVNNDYVWSAGYYAPYREDWIYVQPHWVWTPRGYVFINGYWDWRVPRRGQIFAPIYVTSVVYSRPNYFYTPRCTINTSNLFVHLWVRDSYCHYYFGNYYGPTYAHRHFTPWCNYNTRPRCYDPLFTYCNVHYNRQGINYAQRMKSWHNHYDHHEHERPKNTWREQVAQHHDHGAELRGGSKQPRPSFLGEDLKDIVRKPDQHWKKQDIAARDHNKTAIEQVKQLHNLRLNQEKVSLVSNNGPGRGGSGRDLPSRDNDRDPLPSKRDSIPGRGPDLKLPGNDNKPNVDNPADKIAATQQALAGKFKLPKSVTTANLSPDKPRINVPEKPEKTVVSRPLDRNPLDRKPGDFNPSKLPSVVDKKPDDNNKRNPLDNPGRLPGTRNPATGLGPQLGGPTNTNVETPKVNPLDRKPLDVKPLDVKPRETNPLTNREPKKPDLGGNANATNALQQKLDAMRQQQQDAINAARNRKSEVTTPKLPNLGGNNASGGNTTRTIEAPKVDLTPKVDRAPKIELPKREATRPSFSPEGNAPRNSPQPRNFGGNAGGNSGGINLGGASQPRTTPRTLTPSVEPRTLKPSVEPRTLKPSIQPNSQPSRSTTIQGLQPRNSVVPRVNPGNANPGGGNNVGGNNDKEKKRSR